MKLPNNVPAQFFEIHRPRWKQRAVGLAKYRIGDHNAIEIKAISKKDGRRYYPDLMYISGDKAKNSQYEEQTLQPSGLVVVLVPINDLEVLEREG